MTATPRRIFDPLRLAEAERIAYEDAILVRIPYGGVICRENYPSIPEEAASVGYCTITVRRLSHETWGRIVESIASSPQLAVGTQGLLLDLLTFAQGGDADIEALQARLMTGDGLWNLLIGAIQITPEHVGTILRDALSSVPGFKPEHVDRLFPEQMMVLLEAALDLSWGQGGLMAMRYFQHARQRLSAMRLALEPTTGTAGASAPHPASPNSGTRSAKKSGRRQTT